jgi:Domain of unknown function (DUF4403)
MKQVQILFILSLISLLLWPFAACKAQQKSGAEPKAPIENYDPYVDTPVVSTITIPVQITKYELNRMFDAKLSGPLYEDYSYDDQGGDGIMMNLWKNGPVQVEVYSNVIKYKIPLKYWLKKKLFVGEAESDGAFEISFKTTYTLNQDWTINTNTTTEYHTWTKPPVIKTGWGDVTIEWIANMLLKRSKAEVALEIDKAVKENLNLRQMVLETWVSLQSPTLVSVDYQLWMKVTPQSISMTPFYTSGDAIMSKIGVECVTDVTFGAEPRFRANRELPPLQVVNYIEDDAFKMRVITDLTFAEAERLANASMKDFVMDAGNGKQVKVEGLNLWGDGDLMVVKAKLSGAFNGHIYFKGTPTFNQALNMIEMKDFDYDIETRNFLHRTASWLFSGTIRKKMEESMMFPLDENLWAMRTAIQTSLDNYQVSPGIMMQGKIDHLQVDETRLTKGSIRIVLFADGKLLVNVAGL